MRGLGRPTRAARRAWLLVCAGVAVLGISACGPAHSAQSATRTSDWRIEGSGHVAQTDFRVAVRSRRGGLAPTGSLTLSGFFSFRATAMCLNVAGRNDVAGFHIQIGEGAGKDFLVSSQDNGPTRAGRRDEIYYSGILARPLRACPAPSDPPPLFVMSGGGGPVTAGDLTIAGGARALRPPWRPAPVRSAPSSVYLPPLTHAPVAPRLTLLPSQPGTHRPTLLPSLPGAHQAGPLQPRRP